ncbi:hypothetical protein KAR91_55785 [Candidatus Pacearchaeota archaeon]|nr:hypothetical protein [Candidatus Pacearchaeota archaeon]
MRKEEIFAHITKAVQISQGTDEEIINLVYDAVKTQSTRSTRSARRVKILSGEHFGGNIVFFLELLDQCGLEVVEKAEN